MSNDRPDMVVLSHDFSCTGVVRNGVRVANLGRSLGLCTEYWTVSPEGGLKEELAVGIRTLGIGSNASGLLPRRLADLRAVPSLARMIRERRPKILFSAGNHFHLTAGAAFRLAGCPGDVCYMGRASNAVAGPERLGRKFFWLRPLIKRWERIKFVGMNPIIAVAEELARDLEQTGIAPERLRVIANGVDMNAIAAACQMPLEHDWLKPGSPPLIIAAGRISFQKNHPLLLEAFAIARRARPMRLMLLGRGPTDRLAAQAERLGIAQDVRFEGFASNPYAYFARASLFVLSSRWEGMSNVLLEAMACGCPVAAVNVPTGTAEVLDQGKAGPLVRPDDPEALATAMLQRLDAPRGSDGLRERAAQFSLQRCLEHYTKILLEER